MSVVTEATYAGDIAPQDAYGLLTEDASAVLIDVRTIAEWAYVGYTDLSACQKEPVFVEWQSFPDMSVNTRFVDDVEACCAEANGGRGLSKDQRLLFICRSGVRSVSAAKAMTERGYSQCFNVVEGFEGDRNRDRHRGALGGWKMRGLPWAQN